MPLVTDPSAPIPYPAEQATQTPAEIRAAVAQRVALFQQQQADAAAAAQEQAARAQAKADADAAALAAAAAAPPPAAEQAQVAPVRGRGDGFVDPRLTPDGQAAQVAAAGGSTNTFPGFLATQTMYPNVRTLADFQAAPPRIKSEMLKAGFADRLKDKSITREEGLAMMKAAERKYLVGPDGKKETESSGVLGGAADIGLEAVAGLGSVVKSFSDLLNPNSSFSQWMGGQLKEIGDAKSANAQRDKAWVDSRIREAMSRGATVEAVKAWLKDGVGNSPAETMANLAGSFAPMLAGVAAGAVGLGARAVMGVQGGTGAAQGAGAVRGQIFETAKQAALAKGMDEAAATAAAEAAANPLQNSTAALHMAAGGLLGIVASTTGIEKALIPGAARLAAAGQTASLAAGIGARTAARAAAVAAKIPGGGAAGRAAAAGVREAVPEALQNAQQTYGANSAAADAGLRDPAQNSEGVGLSAAQGGILGLVAGAGLHPVIGAGAPAVEPVVTAPAGITPVTPITPAPRLENGQIRLPAPEPAPAPAAPAAPGAKADAPPSATVHTAESWAGLNPVDRRAYTSELRAELADAKTLADAEAVRLNREASTSTAPRPDLAAYEALKARVDAHAAIDKKQKAADAALDRAGLKGAAQAAAEEAAAIARDGTAATAPRPARAEFERLKAEQAARRRGDTVASTPKPTAAQVDSAVDASHNLPEDLADQLWSAKLPGVGDPVPASVAFATVAADKSADPVDRAVSTWLHSVMPEGVTVTADSSALKGNLGVYVRETKTISLDKAAGMNRRTLLHEGTHAVTAHVLDGVMADLQQQTAWANSDRTAPAPTNQYSQDQHAAAQALQGLSEVVGRSLQDSPKAGLFKDAFASTHEFVAEAMSDPAFQTYMKTVPVEVAAGLPTTLWSRFKTTLRGLLGLPQAKVPDNAFEAVLDATSTLAGAPMADAHTTADNLFRKATARGKPQSARARARAQAIRDEILANRREDFIFARHTGDAKGIVRGTGVWDENLQAYDLTWHGLDGTRHEFVEADVDDAKAWLRSQENGEGRVDGVQKHSQNSTDEALHTMRLRAATSSLDSIVPGVAKVAEQFNALLDKHPVARAYISENAVHDFARTIAGVHQWIANKDQALDLVRAQVEKYQADMAADPIRFTPEQRSLAERVQQLVGADAAMRKRAEALAQRTNAGIDGVKSWADHRNGVRDARKALVAAGLPDHVASDLAYAATAAQRNAVGVTQYPFDDQGNAKDPDFAKFHYYADAAGNIVAEGAPGAVKVTGEDAPTKYKDQVARQFPQHAQGLKDMLEGIKQGNAHVIGYMLANGAILESDAAKLRGQLAYLPLQQTDKRASARIGAALGRRSKARDPMAQWMAVLDARVEAAGRAGVIRSIGMAVQAMPMPSLARVNDSNVKLEPVTAQGLIDAATPEDVLKLQRADWMGEDSVVFRVGDETFSLHLVDPQLLAALKPNGPKEGSAQARALAASREITSKLSFMRVGLNPGFVMTQVFWDSMLAIGNMQGAWTDSTGASKVGNMEAVKLSAEFTGKLLKSAFDGGLRDSYRRQFAKGTASSDPVRALYDARGGGIHMDAKLELQGSEDTHRSMLDLVKERRAGAVVRRGLNNFEHGVQGIGHTWGDTVRFEAFKTYLEHRHGGPFKSAAALMDFADRNPEAVNTAVTGSKNLIGNYERMGESAWARAVLPFFNAGMVGTTQVLPQVLSSRYGWGSMMALTGIATLAAMAALADPDDVDDDGESKFLAKANTMRSIKLGDFTMPVSPEQGLAIVAGVSLATLMSDRDLNHADLHGKLWAYIKGLSPVRTPDFENAGLAQSVGLIGIPFMLTQGLDGMGNSVLPADRVTAGTPDHMRPRNQDSQFAIDAADALHALSMDVAPGSVTNFMQQFSGASYGLANAAVQGDVDGRGWLQGMVDQISKSFVYAQPNAQAQESFALRDRKAVANAAVIESGDAEAIAKLDVQDRQVSSIKSASGLTQFELSRELAKARRLGDSDAYQALVAERDALSQRQDALRGRQINMLRPL